MSFGSCGKMLCGTFENILKGCCFIVGRKGGLYVVVFFKFKCRLVVVEICCVAYPRQITKGLLLHCRTKKTVMEVQIRVTHFINPGNHRNQDFLICVNSKTSSTNENDETICTHLLEILFFYSS